MLQAWKIATQKSFLILKQAPYSTLRSLLIPRRISSLYVYGNLPNHLKASSQHSLLLFSSSPFTNHLRLFHTKHWKKDSEIHYRSGAQYNFATVEEAYASGLSECRKRYKKRSLYRSLCLSVFIAGLGFFFILRRENPLAKLFNREVWQVATNVDVKFNDVIGCDEVLAELQHVVEFLRNPNKFTDIGAKLPKGVLLVGPPGVGKTLAARAVAGEANVTFFHVSGSHFDDMFIGSGASRLRHFFQEAKRHAPCVVFIDEFDSIGSKRVTSVLHPEANQTINQLLAEMDGFASSAGIVVLAATNRKEHLDPAILRPGRFDVEVSFWLPNIVARKALFEHYLKKVSFNCTKNAAGILQLAGGTANFTGAHIANLVNQAALRAASMNRKEVTMDDLWAARDVFLIGLSRKLIPDPQLNREIAIRQAGQALVSLHTPYSTPLHKVAIVGTNQMLGYTSHLDEKDQYNLSKAQLQAIIDVAMGGVVAEELFLGNDKVSDLSKTNLQVATYYAENVVMKYGMSTQFGHRVVDSTNADSLSSTTSKLIDEEVNILLRNSRERARQILEKHSEEHRLLVEALLKYETLDAEDVRTVITGGKPKVAALLEKV